jgi:hypothetical protein
MLDIMLALHAQNQAKHASTKVKTVNEELRDTRARLALLEIDVDRLLLVNRALWELLSQEETLDEEHLIEKVKEIDLRDGTLDGKFRKAEIKHCTSCGRVLNRRHYRCLYCGSESLNVDPLNSVR